MTDDRQSKLDLAAEQTRALLDRLAAPVSFPAKQGFANEQGHEPTPYDLAKFLAENLPASPAGKWRVGEADYPDLVAYISSGHISSDSPIYSISISATHKAGFWGITSRLERTPNRYEIDRDGIDFVSGIFVSRSKPFPTVCKDVERRLLPYYYPLHVIVAWNLAKDEDYQRTLEATRTRLIDALPLCRLYRAYAGTNRADKLLYGHTEGHTAIEMEVSTLPTRVKLTLDAVTEPVAIEILRTAENPNRAEGIRFVLDNLSNINKFRHSPEFFENPSIQAAILSAIDQATIMQAQPPAEAADKRP
jgi:hypothetical protein